MKGWRRAGGTVFIRLYYRYSPQVALVIQNNEVLRAGTRWALAPLVYTVVYPRIALFILITVPLGSAQLRRRHRRRKDAR
jgi:hypothetical protein